MCASGGRAEPPRRPRPRWLVPVIALAVVVAVTLVGLVFIPYHTTSTVLFVSSGRSATADLSIPQAGWVSVHFEHRAGMAMTYWMGGGGGMMFNHSMMQGQDSYSFWTWGGTFTCGAFYAGSGGGMVPVWVNATWGLI